MEETANLTQKNNYTWVFYAVVILILVFLFFKLPLQGLRINDGGQKYIQMQSFVMNKWKTLAIGYPGRFIDPALKYISQSKQHGIFFAQEGKLYSIYQPLFTFLSSLFYPFMGDRVIHFIPMLTFLASVFVMGSILKIVVKPGPIHLFLLFIYTFASPVILYSITFWEHVPSVFLVVCGMYFMVKYFYRQEKNIYLILMFFFLGLTLFFRQEVSILIVSVFIVLLIYFISSRQSKPISSMVIGLLVSIGLYFVNNLIFYKRLISMEIFANVKEGIVYLQPYNVIIFSIFSCILCMAIFGVLKKSRNDTLYDFIPVIWFGFFLLVFFMAPVRKLFTEFPVCLILFYNFREFFKKGDNTGLKLDKIIAGIFILYVTGAVLWSNLTPHQDVRYYLPVIPFVVLFVAIKQESILKDKNKMFFLFLFVVVSFSSMLYRAKTDMLYYKYETVDRLEFLKKHTQKGDVVVFDFRRIMEICGPLYFERIFLINNRTKDLYEICSKLDDKGYDHLYFWNGKNPYQEDIMKIWNKVNGKYKVVETYYFKRGEKMFKIGWEESPEKESVKKTHSRSRLLPPPRPKKTRPF
ncbi:MAG: hypothetical protein ABIH89_10405 [Elusimicrobiota bacterium]